MNAKGKKKTVIKAVRETERTERIHHIISIGAIFAVRCSTNRTAKYIQRYSRKNLAME